MTAPTPAFRPADASLSAAGIVLSHLRPLIDGAPLACAAPRVDAMNARMDNHLARSRRTGKAFRYRDRVAGSFVRRVASGLRLDASLEEAAGASIESIGLRIGRADSVLRYLRNGYTSWDGSYFIELDSARGVVTAETGALTGHAVTALVARQWRRSSAWFPATRPLSEPLPLRIRRATDDRRRNLDRSGARRRTNRRGAADSARGPCRGYVARMGSCGCSREPAAAAHPPQANLGLVFLVQPLCLHHRGLDPRASARRRELPRPA